MGLAALLVISTACSGPVGVRAEPDSSSSSESGDTGASGSVGTSTGPGFEPTRTTGCGDGIVEPGEYCFRKVALPAAEYEHAVVEGAFGLDIDGDGRDELIVDDLAAKNLVLFLDEGDRAFTIRSEIELGAPEFDFVFPWDWDGDGRIDLVVPNQGDDERVLVLRNLGDTLADAQTVDVGVDFVVNGPPVPFDLGSDGVLDFIVAAEWPLDQLGAHVRTRVGGSWVDVGPRIPLPGCGAFWKRVYADFDGDGHLDVAIHDSVTGCKPYPIEYDPEFHRISVFTHDGAGGVKLAGTFPTGGWGESGLWVDDFDSDGHTDVLIEPSASAGVSLLTGRGDGTLNEPQVISTLPGTTEFWRLGRRGDFDGDGDQEWFGVYPSSYPDSSLWLAEELLGGRPIVSLPGWMPAPMAVADFNGDGIDDYLDHEINPLGEKIVVLSDP
jgi:hypothetical protein